MFQIEKGQITHKGNQYGVQFGNHWTATNHTNVPVILTDVEGNSLTFPSGRTFMYPVKGDAGLLGVAVLVGEEHDCQVVSFGELNTSALEVIS